ncbi:MAG: hypothetical protein R3F13_02740 [Prosthecobacter sp.]
MNRERWIVSTVTLSLLWLLGALLILPGMEKALQTAARSRMESDASLTGRLERVTLTFDGQMAQLGGEVRSIRDRESIEAAVRDHVRASAGFAAGMSLRLNPVASVNNEIALAPYPPGWLLLAAEGAKARLTGAVASEFEARDLARSILDRWSAGGGMVEGEPIIDASNHDEAPDVAATLRGLPAPQALAQAHIAKIGNRWITLNVEKSESALLTEVKALGIGEEDWKKHLQPALRRVRQTRQAQRAAETEAQRLAALPAGHVFLAARQGEVLMRGEVGSTAVKNSLLDDALKFFAPRQVRDEIRVSSGRRPVAEFGPVTTALLPDENDRQEKSLFLGFGGEAWHAVDWKVGDDAKPWEGDLPAGVRQEWLLADSARVIAWLQGAPEPEKSAPPSFVTLAVCDGKVILGGQLAGESARTQIIAAVRRACPPDSVVLYDDLHLKASAQRWSGILHTVKSLPQFPAGGLSFALAVPGSDWIELPVTFDLIEAGGIARSGLLPPDLPAALVDSHSTEAMEHFRARLPAHPPPLPR